MLEEYGLSPLHRFGQNFLHDHNVLAKLVDASDVQDGDLILEVGPGTGALTELLLERGCRVVACELDRGLTGLLNDRFGDDITLIQGDCLSKKQLNPEVVHELDCEKWKLISNLPYQIASPLIVDILTNHSNCLGQFVTIQYEVAQRLMANVDSEEWGVLSILVQRLADVSLIAKVPNSCFWPQPKVMSACVRIFPNNEGGELDSQSFAEFVTMLFSKRRKQIGTILGRATELPDGITADMRPATLTIPQLESLYRFVRTSED